MIEDNILKRLQGDPKSFILRSADPTTPCTLNWNRYLPFFRHGNCWVPYHQSYCALWAAIKWGCQNQWAITEHFIMDLSNGEIVYNDWENKDE